MKSKANILSIWNITKVVLNVSAGLGIQAFLNKAQYLHIAHSTQASLIAAI